MSNYSSDSGLGSERKTVYTVSTTLEASSGTSKHKAMVVIEPPVTKTRSASVEAVVPISDGSYAAKPSTSGPQSGATITQAVNNVNIQAMEPTVAVMDQKPAVSETTNAATIGPVPVPFSFELASSMRSESVVSETILPFSTSRIMVMSTEVPKSDLTSQFQESSQPNQTDAMVTSEETPGRPDAEPKHNSSVAIPISNGTALGYSSAARGPDTRSTGQSPPNLSYSQASVSSASTSLVASASATLSYSQATTGSTFAQSQSESQKASFHAQPYAGTSYGSGSSHISGIPSYASPASTSAQ